MRVAVRAASPLAAGGIARLARAVLEAEGARPAALSITLVSPRRIRALNRAHLGRDRETDVVAFALEQRDILAGDIYVCPRVAARNAREAGTSPAEELRRVVVHGVLHVLGHRHPRGAAARVASPMWRRQERYLRTLGPAVRGRGAGPRRPR